jgi:hypothetical protein
MSLKFVLQLSMASKTLRKFLKAMNYSRILKRLSKTLLWKKLKKQQKKSSLLFHEKR